MASRLVLSSTRRVRIQPRNIFTPLLNPKHHSRPSAGGSSCSLQVSTFSRSLPFLSQNKDSKANAHESWGTRAGNTEKDADDESPSSAVKNKRLDPYADESSTTSEPGAGDKDNSHASDPSPTGTGNSGDADPRGSTVEDGAGSSNDNSTSNKDSGIGAGRGPLTWGAVALLGITGALLLGYYQMEREKRETQVASDVKTTGKPALGGPFTLVDMHGRPVTDKDFHGYFAMLYFGFCHCPDICPSELVKVGAIAKKLQDKLGEGVVKPVFISVDPDRDSLAQLRHYAQDFHKSIEYLTGTKDQVAKAAKAYRVYFSKTEEHEEGEDYLVDHSIVIYLLAPDGDFLDFFTQRTTIADCVEKTLKHVTDFRASSKDKR